MIQLQADKVLPCQAKRELKNLALAQKLTKANTSQIKLSLLCSEQCRLGGGYASTQEKEGPFCNAYLLPQVTSWFRQSGCPVPRVWSRGVYTYIHEAFLYYQLTYEPKGSGKLKRSFFQRKEFIFSEGRRISQW